LFNKFSNLFNKFINIIISKLTKNKNLTINSIIYDENGRYYQYILGNNNLLTHKDVLRGIYNILMDEVFIIF